MVLDPSTVPTRDLVQIRQLRREHVTWRFCAWSGVVYLVGAVVFWAVIAGFAISPPHEGWHAARTALYFRQHGTRIRIGMEGVLVIGFFYAPFSIGLSRLMRRAEGPRGMLHEMELIGGLATALISIGCAIAWLTATFRAGSRPPGDIQTLNDLGWMIFDMTALVTIAQMFAFGATWLERNDPAEPLYPRWVGYLSIVTASLFLFVFAMPWLTSGVLAWQGLVGLYVAFGAFFVWMVPVLILTFRAIARVQAEDQSELERAQP